MSESSDKTTDEGAATAAPDAADTTEPTVDPAAGAPDPVTPEGVAAADDDGLDNLDYRELQKLAKDRELEATGSTEELLERLRAEPAEDPAAPTAAPTGPTSITGVGDATLADDKVVKGIAKQQKALQKQADEQQAQGFAGDKVDPRDNSEYSLESGPASPSAADALKPQDVSID